MSPMRLTGLKNAGVAGVVLGWRDVSDANAKDQYVPFSKLCLANILSGQKPVDVGVASRHSTT
jgi:hypothetical protein